MGSEPHRGHDHITATTPLEDHSQHTGDHSGHTIEHMMSMAVRHIIINQMMEIFFL